MEEKLQKEREKPDGLTMTGNGLKDPDRVFRVSKEPLQVEADVQAVEKL